VEAAGGSPLESFDGRSLLSLAIGRSQDVVHDALFWDQGTDERPDWAVRVGPWKLRQAPGFGATRNYCGSNCYDRPTTVRSGLTFYDYPTPSGKLLYNLDDDPGEQTNLADKMPDKVAELTARYARWHEQMETPFNARQLLKQGKPLPPRDAKR